MAGRKKKERATTFTENGTSGAGETATVEVTETKAPKRTPLRVIGEHGFGDYWPILSEADREAVAEHLRRGTVKYHGERLADVKARADRMVKDAESSLENARTAETRFLAVLEKCRKLDETAKGPSTGEATEVPSGT